jgi:hypothetical protein
LCTNAILYNLMFNSQALKAEYMLPKVKKNSTN